MISKPNLILPNLFIGGVQKSGTTYLHNLLKQHPDVFTPKYPQEIHFFDFDSNYNKGLKHYSKHFRQWDQQKIIFQTSPLYIYLPSVPDRIAEVLPDSKFIFILRNPIDRAYSHYWHSVRYTYETLSFGEAIMVEPERIVKNADSRRYYSYLDRGKYAEQLERYYHTFGQKNILVILFDDLKQNVNDVLEKCAFFLDIDFKLFPPNLSERIKNKNQFRLPRNYLLQQLSNQIKNSPLLFLSVLIDKINSKLTTYPPIEKEIKTSLQEFFKPEIKKLERLIDQDLSYWLK